MDLWGPFAHIVEGDLDLKAAGTTISYDIEEDAGFGGYVSLLAKLMPDLSVIAEFQITADAYLLTAGVTFCGQIGQSYILSTRCFDSSARDGGAERRPW